MKSTRGFLPVSGVLTLLAFVGCTNYSASQIPVNPALLLGPSPTGKSTSTGLSAVVRTSTGVLMTVAASNTEPTFTGYRIYEAATEAAVVGLPAASGTDCGPFYHNPLPSVAYKMEASLAPSYTGTDHLCDFPVNLTAGNYLAIRARYFAGFGQPELTSMSSNALLVP